MPVLGAAGLADLAALPVDPAEDALAQRARRHLEDAGVLLAQDRGDGLDLRAGGEAARDRDVVHVDVLAVRAGEAVRAGAQRRAQDLAHRGDLIRGGLTLIVVAHYP